MSLQKLREDLKQYWRPEKADFLQKYFFAEGGNASKEIFRGISVPNTRLVAKSHFDLTPDELSELLKSKVHEEKLISLIILVSQYKKASDNKKEELIKFFIEHTAYIDDWDLTDNSDKILGDYLSSKADKSILIKLADSKNWWERRIAVIATFQFIKDSKNSEWTFKLAEKLLEDKHDLIHKAVGWMLREVGKRISIEEEKKFLNPNYKKMPRTMLRYAIEHFPQTERSAYLKGEI